MKIYASHLIETEEMKDILRKYPINLEIVNFGSAMILDNWQHYLKEYKKDMEEFISQREVTIHGPFVDMSPGSPDKEIRRVTRDRFQLAFNIAKELKAKHIIFHSGYIPKVSYAEEWLENSKEFWRGFTKDNLNDLKTNMNHEGLEIHIENVFDEDYVLIKELIEYINYPSVSACLDIGHANASSPKSLDHWIKGLGKSIGYVHLHNNDGKHDYHNPLTNGTIDIKTTLNQLKLTVPNAPWSLEIFSKEGIIDSIELIKSIATI
ncbi:Sugar phosphate isomerase/epimerase [Clostridium amylolyticum]|uniref:Sugar phosphate isomerase/epimerase n=1 Tax=Clostridium amylolyticum TaxID=1121298 RepID=A0A1M6LU73_9CLOT|nr:sugar phosphate isomerase/epimerase family protein [Clostridium amylolyticum]SHJ74696.1 Sugar phosphate isomerase/epimerase [Clostridium amylolyticum]